MGARGPKGVAEEAVELLRAGQTDPATAGTRDYAVAEALGVSRERIRQIREAAGLAKAPARRRCRICGKPAGRRANDLCYMHLYREKRGIPLDAPPMRGSNQVRRLCSDCGAVPAKVRGRCQKCARQFDPVFREAERQGRARRYRAANGLPQGGPIKVYAPRGRRRAERAARAKDSSKILPENA